MRILLVENNDIQRHHLNSQLQNANFIVDCAKDTKEAGYYVNENNPSLIIMDINLPEVSGSTTIREWRNARITTPVIVLSDLNGLSDKVTAFNSGADMYVEKPCHIEELIMRIHCLTRRNSLLPSRVIKCGKLKLDLCRKILLTEDEDIKLTSYEYKILYLLMKNVNKVMTKQNIMFHIYDDWIARECNTVEILIGRLRKKMARYGRNIIATSRGKGYYFNSEAIKAGYHS
jgi:two-component system response regulator PhoP